MYASVEVIRYVFKFNATIKKSSDNSDYGRACIFNMLTSDKVIPGCFSLCNLSIASEVSVSLNALFVN